MGRPLRVLCTSTGGAGHIAAVAPVARALRDLGHDVRWAVAADGGAAVAAMDFEWSEAGLTTAARRAAAGAALGEIMQLPVDRRRGPLLAALFAEAAGPAMRRDLGPIVDDLRPDVVLREATELAAAPIAVARGVPLVTVAASGALPARFHDEVADAMRPLWHAEGLDDPSWEHVYGQLYLHPFPASFGQRPDSSVVQPIRPDGGAASTGPPRWVAALGVDRPFVYVTAGTEPPSVGFPWRELLTASDALDVDVVATIGPHVDPAHLGVVPPNVRVETFVPQADLLGRASVVVSHGGAGTMLGAASRGRPQLIVPLFADQWENGVAVDDAGCGIVLGPTRRGTEDLEQALQTLLAGSAHREAATRVADEIAAMPTATDLAPEIEALVETGD
jgi:UDP:flavonoid glycosyltransferase YjiC (YdhE family)